jgi:hypothetical protein
VKLIADEEPSRQTGPLTKVPAVDATDVLLLAVVVPEPSSIL